MWLQFSWSYWGEEERISHIGARGHFNGQLGIEGYDKSAHYLSLYHSCGQRLDFSAFREQKLNSSFF